MSTSVTRREWLASAALSRQARPVPPNILFVFIDDLGYGDFGVTGNRVVPTPNMDRLAKEGVRFTQFYTASPICSPSRVGVMTGQCPARHRVNNYFSNRAHNAKSGMPDWLDPNAPSVARAFQQAGYATGHFGKWHMGGGRDVGDDPLPQAYGFEESVTSFEGLGDRILIENDGLSKQSSALGRGKIEWAPKHKLTERYIDRTLEFIRGRKERPFYAHLWLCDVHDAHQPTPDAQKKWAAQSSNPYVQKFYAVLEELDRQVGRLVDELDHMGLAQSTLIAITGDNGPTAWPYYYKEGFDPPGSTAGYRGRKWSLYEGGIRQPFIARWKGTIPTGRVDEQTVLSAVDLFPTFCSMARIGQPRIEFDGENRSAALLGKPIAKRRPLFWEYGRNESYLRPGLKEDQSPNLAMRDARWKILVNDDGSNLELYDFASSQLERENVAAKHPKEAKRLSDRLLAWRRGLPD